MVRQGHYCRRASTERTPQRLPDQPELLTATEKEDEESEAGLSDHGSATP